jgi:hypothetical protein
MEKQAEEFDGFHGWILRGKLIEKSEKICHEEMIAFGEWVNNLSESELFNYDCTRITTEELLQIYLKEKENGKG